MISEDELLKSEVILCVLKPKDFAFLKDIKGGTSIVKDRQKRVERRKRAKIEGT